MVGWKWLLVDGCLQKKVKNAGRASELKKCCGGTSEKNHKNLKINFLKLRKKKI